MCFPRFAIHITEVGLRKGNVIAKLRILQAAVCIAEADLQKEKFVAEGPLQKYFKLKFMNPTNYKKKHKFLRTILLSDSLYFLMLGYHL